MDYQDGTYLENNPTWHAEHSDWKAENIVRILSQCDVRPRRICEIGCGAGGVLAEVAKRLPDARELHGYDISPQAHELCAKRDDGDARLHYHLADLLEVDAHFDVVLAIDVFEHVEDCFGFLRRLRAKGDVKVFHIPLDVSVLSVLHGHMMQRRTSVGHIHYFTRDTALALLADTGYRVEASFYTPGGYKFLRRNPKGVLKAAMARTAEAIDPHFAARLMGGYSLMVLAR